MTAEILSLGRKLRASDYRVAAQRAAQPREEAVVAASTAIVSRWMRAGLTTAVLIAGLPVPRGPHAGDWVRGGSLWRCSCGHWSTEASATCGGVPAYDLVEEALRRGVPFGLRDGLPTAGVEVDTSGIRARLARVETAMMVRRASALKARKA